MMMWKAIILIALVVWLLSPISSAQQKGVKEDEVTTIDFSDGTFNFDSQWAFIIGISDYSKIKSLSNAAFEAQKLEKLLIDKYGFNPRKTTYRYCKIEHLFNQNATYAAIIKRLNWYRDNLKEKDILFIYFSGHGYVDKDGIGCWLPYDVGDDLKDAKRMKHEEVINISSKKILNYRIVKFLEKCKARNIFVVADSCYAGEIFSEFKSGAVPSRVIKEKSRQLLAAGSNEVPDPSPFSNFLIDFLNNNSEPYIMASTIISQAKESLGRNFAPRGGYVPRTDSKGGEFILVRPLASLKPFKYKPNLPSDPADIDVSGLKAEAEKKRLQRQRENETWQNWQWEFQKEVEKKRKIDEDKTKSFTSKKNSWGTILSKYKKNNPYSGDDEELRKFVSGRIEYWKAKEREEIKWANWQRKFKENVDKLEKLEKDPDISSASKKEKWQELLKAYEKDNPYSEEDELLKEKIKENIKYWGRTLSGNHSYLRSDIIHYRSTKDVSIEVELDSQNSVEFRRFIYLLEIAPDEVFFEWNFSFFIIRILGRGDLKDKKIILRIILKKTKKLKSILSNDVDYLLYIDGKEFKLDKRDIRFEYKTNTLQIKANIRNPQNRYIQYHTKKGNTLYQIAKSFNLDTSREGLEKIKKINGSSNDWHPIAGQIIKLPTPECCKNGIQKWVYVIKRGDTFFSIASTYLKRCYFKDRSTFLNAIFTWNGIKGRNNLKLGSKLILYLCK